MKLHIIQTLLNAEVAWGSDFLDRDISMGSCSDLLSDVLVYTKSEALLITGLTNAQVVRSAEMVEAAAICFVHGKKPEQSTIDLAKEKEIPLLYTEMHMFKACGILYANGLSDCVDIRDD